MKKTTLLLITLALGFSLVAIAALAQKPKTYPTVPLIVSFRDAGSTDCNTIEDPRCADRIRSDGLGAYTHGVQGVSATIDQYGYLNLNFQTSDSPLRQVYFDYSVRFPSASNPEPPLTPPAPGLQPKAQLTTLPLGEGNYTPIQNMALGSSQCVKTGIAFTWADKKKTQWRSNFRRSDTFTAQTAQTSYGVVTCEGVDSTGKCISWTLEPKSNCSGYDSIGELLHTPTVGPFNFTDYGLYYLPFKLTLTKK
ncbi:MAG TPA: hypothetical protein VFZ34_12635 [Blastocatellia bacterium]|nr:hypothetical protein [Blastocatellia bacterium]